MTILRSIFGTVERRAAVVTAILAFAIACIYAVSWVDARDSQRRLQSTIDTQSKSITAATNREAARDSQLKQILAQISEAKRRAQTPAQAAVAIPAELPQLPEPIQIEMPQQQIKAQKPTTGGVDDVGGSPATAIAQIPEADLKPILDAAEDCKACQAKLAAAEANLTDQAAKLTAISAERDAAVKAAKGGSIWTRVTRAAKWLAIGAAVGAVAARAAR